MTKLAIPPGASIGYASRRLAGPSFWRPNANSDTVDLTTSSRPAVTATASPTPHTKGAWAEVIAVTSADATWLTVVLAATTGVNGVDTSALLDIGIGASGAEQVIVPNLAVGYGTIGNTYAFPLRIPKGSRVAVRTQAAVASQQAQVRLILGALPHGKQAPGSLVALGANTATSRGVSITGTTVNTKSAWVEIVSATTQPFGGVVLGVQGDGDVTFTSANALVDVGVGASGSEVVLLADYPINEGSAELIRYDGGMPIAGALIPAGSRLAVRWARGNAGNSLDAILHGVPLT